MQQAWENVETLLNEMKPHLIRAGIPERQVTMPEADPLDITSDKYVAIFDWLHNLKMGPEWAGILKVWKLRREEIWQRYIDFEITGLQEQILLQGAQAKLRKAWRTNRPFFFGRKFKKQGETTDGENQNQEDSALKDSDTQDSV